jgi:ABC-2 type transport system ATP-binding protein
VDPLSRRQFWRLIDALAESKVTVLVTTHYLDEAERCHRVALIHAGRLATIGSVSDVKTIFSSRPIVEVRAGKPVEAMNALDALPEVEKTSLFGTAVHAVLRSPEYGPDYVRTVLKNRGLDVLSVDRVEPSLEDVFLDVVEKAS